jgi:hypothetical protein
MLPIAPFSIVNVVAGASHIRWSDFLLGTVIGLAPGITTLTFFVDRAIAAIREPAQERSRGWPSRFHRRRIGVGATAQAPAQGSIGDDACCERPWQLTPPS